MISGSGDAANLDRALFREARDLLAQAALIAETPSGQTTQIGRQHPASAPPPARGTAAFDEFHYRLIKVTDDEQLEAFIAWAERELYNIRHSPDRQPETITERDERILGSYENSPAQYVADREKLSLTLIRRIRERGGRVPRTGRPLHP